MIGPPIWRVVDTSSDEGTLKIQNPKSKIENGMGVAAASADGVVVL